MKIEIKLTRGWQLLIILLSSGVNAFADIVQDAAAEPNKADNFYEARTRIWISGSSSRLKGVIAFFNGTDSDSRRFVEKIDWQELAKKNSCALLGCYFRGDGEPYEDASKGSGAALIRMLDDLAQTSGHPELKNVSLFLVGHSSGAMFSYNFARWLPQRTIGFISDRSGPVENGSLSPARFVPGLFIIGEDDEPRRRHSILTLIGSKDNGARWALAIQSGGHSWNRAVDDFIRAYIDIVFPKIHDRRQIDKGYSRDLLVPSRRNIPLSDLMWFPNHQAAKLWASFSKKGTVEAFTQSCVDEEMLMMTAFVQATSKPITFNHGSPVTTKRASIYIGVLPRDTVTKKEIEITLGKGVELSEIISSNPDFASIENWRYSGPKVILTVRFDGSGKNIGNQSGYLDIKMRKSNAFRIMFIAWVAK